MKKKSKYGKNMALRRIFFALTFNNQENSLINKLKAGSDYFTGRPVDDFNLHLTLQFIGGQDEFFIDQLIDSISSPNIKPFHLSFQRLAYYPKNKIGCLEPINSLNLHSLFQLQQHIKSTIQKLKPELISAKQNFMPHITLYRDASVIGELSNYMAGIDINIEKFYLMESISRRNKVHYEILAEWPIYVPTIKQRLLGLTR